MLLSPEQGSHLKDQIYQLLGTEYMPPLTDEERNGLNGIIARDIDQFTTSAPPGPTTLTIVPMPWVSPSRSATQTNACQFKFTVSSTEVPRPGDLSLSPAGPAGNEVFYYKWGTEPFEDAEGGTQGNRAKFSVTTPKSGSYTVVPGQTYYVAVKMTGGNTSGKFLGELHLNAPY